MHHVGDALAHAVPAGRVVVLACGRDGRRQVREQHAAVATIDVWPIDHVPAITHHIKS